MDQVFLEAVEAGGDSSVEEADASLVVGRVEDVVYNRA